MKHPKLILIEEIFNSITHGLGAFASIAAIVFLVLTARQGNALRMSSFVIFGSSLLLMYIFSTLFHSLSYTKAKKIFLIFDRSAIFLLIAGTTTPIALLTLHNWLGWSLMALIWVIAITGITLNAIFPEKYRLMYVPVYLLMGWLSMIIIKPLLMATSLQTIILLISGGVLYTSGTLFYAWNKLPFNHTIWHLFVIGGSICHFLIIYKL